MRVREVARQPEGTVICGCDPGFSGAWSILGQDFSDVFDMPVIGEGAQKMVRGDTLYETLVDAKPTLIVIEQVSAMPGQGVTTMFRFGAAYGAACAIALATGARVELVTPAKWKGKMGLLGTSKEQSRALAIRRFPSLRDQLKRKKDDGRAEALLLADYGRRYILH